MVFITALSLHKFGIEQEVMKILQNQKRFDLEVLIWLSLKAQQHFPGRSCVLVLNDLVMPQSSMKCWMLQSQPKMECWMLQAPLGSLSTPHLLACVRACVCACVCALLTIPMEQSPAAVLSN